MHWHCHSFSVTAHIILSFGDLLHVWHAKGENIMTECGGAKDLIENLLFVGVSFWASPLHLQSFFQCHWGPLSPSMQASGHPSAPLGNTDFRLHVWGGGGQGPQEHLMRQSGLFCNSTGIRLFKSWTLVRLRGSEG